jgi:hypothetical protein
MQRQESVAGARFLAAQIHESRSQSAAVRVGRRPTHSRRIAAVIGSRKADLPCGDAECEAVSWREIA